MVGDNVTEQQILAKQRSDEDDLPMPTKRISIQIDDGTLLGMAYNEHRHSSVNEE